MSYRHKGIFYNMQSSNYDVSVFGAVVGERYEIKINPKKPRKYVVTRWKPIFLDVEERDTTACMVKKIIKDDPAVEFSYYVDDERYYRAQYLPPDYLTVAPDLHIGQHFQVEYLKSDPQRAIIHIDKEIK